jgi:hypothetical protein
MTIDLSAVRLTRQKVNTGIWVCAALTMSASAISGITAFYYLQQDGWGIASGAMTALAVDVALWVVLTGDRLMEAIGLSAGPWARTVRWGTAAMSVTLNITAAAVANIPQGAKIPLIILHAFVPLVMVALAELRGEYARQLAPAEQDALEKEEARNQPPDTPIITPSERISDGLAEEVARLRADLQKQRETPPARPAVVALRAVPTRRQVTASTKSGKDALFDYLDTHYRGDPYGITAEQLAIDTKQNPHTCKKYLGQWRQNLSPVRQSS